VSPPPVAVGSAPPGGRDAESKPMEQEPAAGRARSAGTRGQLRLEWIERLLMPRAAMTFVLLASAPTAKLGKVIEAEGR
jgi:hypothetical protein